MFAHLPCSQESCCFQLEGHQELPGPRMQESLGQAEPLGLFSAQGGCRARQAGLSLHTPPNPGACFRSSLGGPHAGPPSPSCSLSDPLSAAHRPCDLGKTCFAGSQASSLRNGDRGTRQQPLGGRQGLKAHSAGRCEENLVKGVAASRGGGSAGAGETAGAPARSHCRTQSQSREERGEAPRPLSSGR